MSPVNTLSKHDLRELLKKAETCPTCWACGNAPATDIHHIDGNHDNNDPVNLAPWCKRCHNDHHDISDNLTILCLGAREIAALQKFRIVVGNQVAAYGRLGYDATLPQYLHEHLSDLEDDYLKQIAKMLKHEPIYTLYLEKIKGIGPAIAAALLSEIGDPGRFANISKLWTYCGLDVRDGAAPRKRKGETAAWNHRLRMVLVGRMVPGFIKLKHTGDCFGRVLYDQYKAFYLERDGESIPLIHVENRARRKVAKVFLACLWVAWRRVKGMSVTEPYVQDRLGHTHIVTPEDWAGEGWDRVLQVEMPLEAEFVMQLDRA